jgi:hypothetical protein
VGKFVASARATASELATGIARRCTRSPLLFSAAVAAALLLGGYFLLAALGFGKPRPVTVQPDPAEALRTALRQTVDIDWTNVPLDKALQELSERYGLRIDIDRAGLAEAGGIDPEKVLLNRRLQGIPLRGALELVLEPMALDYVWRDAGILVTTREKADTTFVAKVYQVADLTKHQAQFDENALADAIRQLCLPDGWDRDEGSLEIRPGMLLVNATRRRHEHIEDILEHLRWLATGRTEWHSVRPFEVRPMPTAGEEAIQKVLDASVTVDWDQAPKATFREWEDRFGINIVLDTKELEDMGAYDLFDDAISKHVSKPALPNVSLRAALTAMLPPFGCSWVVRHNAIVITSQQRADATLRLRWYRLRPADYTVLGPWDIQSKATGDEFIDVVQNVVAPDSWDETGGPGVAVAVPGGIAIEQTEAVHERIADFLRQLDRALDPRIVDYDEWGAFPNTQRLLRLLQQPVTVDASDGYREIRRFFQHLQTRFKLPNIVFDKKGLEDLGVGVDEKFIPPIPVKNISLASVLDSVGQSSGLGWYVQGNSLVVTSKEGADSRLQTLLYRVPYFRDDPETCIELLTTHVRPDSWADAGGPGEVQAISGVLVVPQSFSVHREIRRFLRQLEAFLDSSADAKYPLACTPAERRLYEALDRPVTYQPKSDQPLTNAVAELAKQGGIENVVYAWWDIDYDYLRESLRSGEFHAKFEAADEPLADALTRLLKPHGLAWTVQHEVLLITAQSDADAHVVTGYYHVSSELIAAIKASIVPQHGESPDVAEYAFGDLIMHFVDQQNAQYNAGPGAVRWITKPDGARTGIVVTHTPAVHRELRKFLDALQRVPPLAAEMAREIIDIRLQQQKQNQGGGGFF